MRVQNVGNNNQYQNNRQSFEALRSPAPLVKHTILSMLYTNSHDARTFTKIFKRFKKQEKTNLYYDTELVTRRIKDGDFKGHKEVLLAVKDRLLPGKGFKFIIVGKDDYKDGYGQAYNKLLPQLEDTIKRMKNETEQRKIIESL